MIKTPKHEEKSIDGQATDILDSIVDPILSVDRESRIVYVNHATEHLFNKESSELVGKSIWNVLPKNIQFTGDFYYQKALSEGKPSKYEDLKLFNIRCDIHFYPADNGLTIFIQDRSSKWQTEELYRLSLYLIERVNENIFLVRSDGRLFHVNDETCHTLGYSRNELIQMKIFDIDTNIKAEKWNDHFADIKKKGSVSFESEFMTREGKTVPVDVNAIYVIIYDVEYYCVAARNISERKRISNALEDAKAQSELYVDLMSHDINNMNQVGIGFLELALDMLKEKGRIEEKDMALLEKPLRAIKDSTRLIDNVRKLQSAKSNEHQLQSIDLREILESVKEQFSKVNGRRITINYTPTESHVLATGLVKEVFVNIVGNAVKHADANKPLEISISQTKVYGTDESYHKVYIDDNGPGIPDELKIKIFNRFERGNTQAKGKGLGLFLVKTLVHDFDGKIWVEDRVKGDYTKGARFVVMLPAVDK